MDLDPKSFEENSTLIQNYFQTEVHMLFNKKNTRYIITYSLQQKNILVKTISHLPAVIHRNNIPKVACMMILK
jgi:hypothetical protein